MAKLGTIERAKRFYKSLANNARRFNMPGHMFYWKQNHAYRALLKQRLKTVESEDWYDDGPQSGYEAGLKEALELHDAVHGRKTDG